MKKIILIALSLTILNSSAFAVVHTECKGTFGQKGKAKITLTRAEDDTEEGSVSIFLSAGTITGTPVHYQFDVIKARYSSDVSILYQDKKAGSPIKLNVSDDSTLGLSYIKNLPGIKYIALSCVEIIN